MSGGLDKFYTNPDTAGECIKTVDMIYKWEWDLVVEPSAGNGSFYEQLPPITTINAIDISPDSPSIKKQDFFDYIPPDVANILVIGNPPFGRVSSLAVQFFNHAAQWARVIAFIVPRTFRRVSIQNKLDMHFKLVHDTELPTNPCCFTPPMMAKCCFQIWERINVGENGTPILRQKVKLPINHPRWTFLPYGPTDTTGQPTPPTGADFAIRAYGGKCGDICINGLEKLRPKSWHWIKSNGSAPELAEQFGTLDYSFSQNTARQNSIGRADLVALYSNTFDTK
jgi:hypothetical protein